MKAVLCRSFTSSSPVKPFSEIPGPRSLPLIGTLWSYLPFIGPYRFDRLHENGMKKLRKYGYVVKEEIIPGEPVVWIFRPEDVQELFKREGRFPQRRSHLALEHIRMNNQTLYNTGGLLPTNGPEWWRLRSNLQKDLSSPQSVKTFISRVNTVLDDFLDHIQRTHNPSAPSDFLNDLSRLFLELLGVVAFNSRLNSFSANELHSRSRTSQLISAALVANSCILRTDNGPQLWRLFPTPLYMRLKRAHDHMQQVALEEIQLVLKKIDKQKDDKQSSCLVEAYLRSSNLNYKDVLGTAVDMILAGTDTTSYTTSFVLYHLARNPDKQQKLLAEIHAVLGENDSPDAHTLAQCQYVKATLKETLRLNPVSVGVGRLLQEDAVFSGYHVPKGTVVVTQNQVMCRLEEYFRSPAAFVPERWLKVSHDCEHKPETVSPYLLLPFGHGARTCIARRLAEQNIQLLIIKEIMGHLPPKEALDSLMYWRTIHLNIKTAIQLIRKFYVEWVGGELDVRSLLINKPDSPIKLRFTQR